MNEILAITRCTIRELARSYHYKLLFLFLSLVLQISYVFAAMYQSYFTVRSPNLGYNGTQFVVGNVDPIHFFVLQFVVVALTLVHSERMRGIDAVESVQAKGYRNVCWTTGTIVGISTLVFVIPLVNFIVIYGVATLGEVFGLDFGPAPELMSVLNLIFVDVPTTIVVYSALTLALHQILRSKLLVGIATLAVALLHLVLIQTMSFDWRELVSHSTTNSMLVSEILPYFSTAWILFNRLVWIFLAFGLVVVAALLDSRRDGLRPRYLHVSLACVGLAIAGFCVHGIVLSREVQEEQRVAATHKISSNLVSLDLTNIRGQVEVHPGTRLLVDVDLSVSKLNDQSMESLQFSFNPGMDLEHVRVDEKDRDFSFVDGLLTIPLSSAESSSDAWIVSIRGSGVPNENFGYPDSQRDYLGTPGTSPQMPKLLGVKNLIFDHRFVALMPGSRWYPVPLPLGIDKSVQSMQTPMDTYFVDLDIHIANKNWKLAAPERLLLVSEDSAHYKIQSEREVPHFAIVASEFHSTTMKAAGVEIELLIHPTHFSPAKSSTAIWNSIMSFVAERLTDLSVNGLPFPYRSLTFVEVPNHLRLVGGYDMPFLYSQPGLVLIRESGIPTAKWEKTYERYLRFELSENQIQHALTDWFLFYNDTNILGGNVLSTVAEQYFPFIDHLFGWENVALNFMQKFLITDVVRGPEGFYFNPSDMSMVEELADLTVIYPSFTLDSLLRRYDRSNPTQLDGETYYRLMLNDASFSVHSMKMSELLQSGDISLRRSAVEYRLADTYEALVALYGSAKLKKLLDREMARVAERSNSQSEDSANELSDSSKPLIPILNEWNESTVAPAFSTSDLEVVRVEVENAPYTHRASFKIRNDSDVTGVVSFSNDLDLETVDTGICVEVPGQTAYQVNLYAEEDFYAVVVDTHYSQNIGGKYLRPLTITAVDSEDITVEKEYPPLTEISWNPHDGSTIIVDNLDPGFSLVGWESRQEPGFLNRVRWPWEPPRRPIRIIDGLERFDWNRPSSNQSWKFLEQAWLSYGRYRPMALATHGNDVENARFSADIPIGGQWSLSYFLFSEYPLMRHLGVHNLVLHDSQGESQIKLDPKDGSGWIPVGEFELSRSTVHLDLVSVDPPNSLRVADAIRWKLVARDEN